MLQFLVILQFYAGLKGWLVSELTSIAKYNSLKKYATTKLSHNYWKNDELVGWIYVPQHNTSGLGFQSTQVFLCHEIRLSIIEPQPLASTVVRPGYLQVK